MHLDLTKKWGDEEMQTLLFFLAIDMWWACHASDKGDKSRASHNFLYHTLPFMANVVLQDGIYWVEEFPNHEVSLQLICKLPGYLEWAQALQEKLEHIEISEQDDCIEQLDTSVQSAFTWVLNEVHAVSEDVRKIKDQIEWYVQELEETVEHQSA